MRARLMAIGAIFDSQQLLEGFVPILLEKAGRQTTALGVAAKVAGAISTYAKGEGDMAPQVKAMMYTTLAPEIIDALVDDEGVASEAKAVIERASKRTQP